MSEDHPSDELEIRTLVLVPLLLLILITFSGLLISHFCFFGGKLI